ncbi:putative copper homeostasis (lipo)protein LpqS [Mycolicibacterium fortuitum]
MLLVIGLLAGCAVAGAGWTATAGAHHVAIAEHDASHASSVAHAHISSPVDGKVCHAPDGVAADKVPTKTQSRAATVNVMLGPVPTGNAGVWLTAARRGPPLLLPLAAKSGRDLLQHLCVIRR